MDGPQGAGAWETGSVTGGEASERDLGDGSLDVHPALGLWGVAGCTVGNPEVEPGVCSSHLDGPVQGHDGSGGGERWGGDGCDDCCCCCNGGCCRCCGHGDDGGDVSVGLDGHAGVSLGGLGETKIQFYK